MLRQVQPPGSGRRIYFPPPESGTPQAQNARLKTCQATEFMD